MTSEDITDELRKLYDEVYEDGFFIKEFQKLTGVGDLRDLEYLAKVSHKELDEAVKLLSMGETVDLTTPGFGSNRVERLKNAWADAKKRRAKGEFPVMVEVRTKLALPSIPKQLGTF